MVRLLVSGGRRSQVVAEADIVREKLGGTELLRVVLVLHGGADEGRVVFARGGGQRLLLLKAGRRHLVLQQLAVLKSLCLAIFAEVQLSRLSLFLLVSIASRRCSFRMHAVQVTLIKSSICHDKNIRIVHPWRMARFLNMAHKHSFW